MQISSRCSDVLKSKMDGTMTLGGRMVLLEEMKAQQGVCMLTSVWAREWQYKELLSDLDDQVCGKRRKPRLVNQRVYRELPE